MIEEIEELSTEFEVAPFSDGGLLEDRQVEVVDALLPQDWNPRAPRYRSPSPEGSETGGIEPSAQPCCRASEMSSCRNPEHVRSETTDSNPCTRERCTLATLADLQREAALEGCDAVESPA